ncbi:PLxRFG domain-containing protein [Janthinobacterium sp. CG3]|uniref:PLxRFG domain-containing protein n=1 Tax=Janthinobacterium sp. CG3 TaxID=1075768 RepID=UPI0018DEDEED
MRAIGYDPKATNEAFGEYLSDSQKASDAQVQKADGFVDSIAASVQNPRSIVGSIAESAPGMLAGMGVTSAIARGIATKAALATAEGAAASAAELAAGKTAAQATTAALATDAGGAAANGAIEAAGARLMATGAATEGAQGAGQIADAAQAEGRNYTDYALPAIAAGAITGGIGYGAGKLMGDAATELATGARSAGVKGGIAARAGREFVSEGVLEEMPQSAQEQYFTNIAQGEQDSMKGVGSAAGAGLVTGGVMGAGMGAMQRNHSAPRAEAPEVPPAPPVPLPNTGPLSRAANAVQAAAAANPVAATPAPALPSFEEISARLAELDTIARGAPTRREPDQNGITVTIPSVKARKFTLEEQAEFKSLMEAHNARTAIPEDQRPEFEAMLKEEAAAQQKQRDEAVAHALAVDQDAQLSQLLAEEQEQQHAAAQAKARADALLEQQETVTTNTIVEHERQVRAEANRAALRNDVLADASIPADQKKSAFRAALRREGYANVLLTDIDQAEIVRATAPIPSAPNELVDVVPELQPAPAAPAKANTKAVDDAIAAGMRLKTPNGAVLHKPGSAKVFRLSTAQKAYYQKKMAPPAAPGADDLYDQAAALVLSSRDASIPTVQSHFKIGYNRAARLMESMEAAGIVSEMESDGRRTVLAEVKALDVAAHEAATSPHNDLAEPTAAQKVAGNYKKAHVNMHGLDISIENPVGSKRSGTDKDGAAWENEMQHHYGYIKGTVGMDKDHIDTFIGANHASDKVFVVDQIDPATGKPDEHKVMLGFDSAEQARAAYQANYATGWAGGQEVTETDVQGFKDWLSNGNTKKPFAAQAKQISAQNEPSAAPAAQPERDAIAARYAALLAERREGVSPAPMEFHRRFAGDLLAKDAYALKWITNGMNDTSKKVFAEFTGTKLPKAQGASWTALKAWAGVTDEQDAAVTARADAARRAKEEQDNDEAAERGARNQKFKAGSNDDTIVTGKEAVDRQIAEGYKSIQNIAKSPVPKYALVNVELGRYYLLDKVAKRYAEVALKRLGQSPIAKDTDGDALTSAGQADADQAEHTRELADAAAKGHTVADDNDVSHLFGKKPAAPTAAAPALPKLTKQELNAIYVTDMTPDQLLQAKEMFAGLPRAKKIDKEIEKRGLTPPVAPAAAVESAVAPPDVAAPAAVVHASTAPEHAQNTGKPLDRSTKFIPTADPADVVDAELSDALSHLGDVLGDVFGAKLNITGQQHTAGALLPALSKVIELLVRRGARSLADALSQSAKVMRANAAIAPHMDQISARQWKAAYNAIAEYHEGTDSEASVAGVDADAVLHLVRGDVAKSDTKTDTEQKEQENDSTATTSSPALDRAVDAGLRPAGSDAPLRGARPARPRAGRADDGSVRKSGRPAKRTDDGVGRVGDGGRADAVSDGQNDAVAGSDERVPGADFRPASGGLTREGSWYETAKRNIDLIDLAIQIDKEGRPATPDEQTLLSKYVGFGAGEIRNKIFPIPPGYAKQAEPSRLIWSNHVADARWKSLAERLEALPRDWQKSVLQSSQYAHYTSEGIIRSVWSAMQRLGFTGGKVFEPGMGIGSFSMLMPEAVRQTSRYTGIEFDGPTALVAKLLSPEQNVLHDDFIKRKFPKNFFDVAIGNPPFSQTKIFGDAEYEKNGFMLHDFFFAKSIDRVRPGGLLAFVTSKGTMDKQTDKARKYLSDRADLLGAIRMPSTAFEANAGTSVVTDVIFLRKRQVGEAPAGAAWGGLQTVDTVDGPVVVNEYFAKHPEMVLGQQRLSGNTDDIGRRIDSNGRGGERYTVVSYDKTPAELDEKFALAVERLPENVYSVLSQSAESVKRETAKVDFDPSVTREGVVYLAKDGSVMRVENGVGRALDGAVKLSENDKAWFAGYVGLRDLVQATRLAQATDGEWAPALKKLNKAYDAFRKEHGPINDFRIQVRKSTDEAGNVVETESRVFKNRRRFREDYDSAILTQLETINEAGEIVKSPFMLGRTIGKPVTREVKSIGDALAVSLDAIGVLDLADVAGRIGLTVPEAVEALDKQVYKTPDGQWQLADEYLAGDVVAKLEEAELAVRVDPQLRRNIEALNEVQPEKLGPSQISAKLGASWVPVSHVNAFAAEIEAGSVTFDPTTETWQVDGGNLRSQRRAGAEYGTAMRSPSELLEAALNSRSVKIVSRDENKKTIPDVEATTAANEALRKIKDKFKGWVWTDSERALELVESYNKRFNNIAPRRFDGSHLTLPGVSLRFNLHPHQLRAIWRMIQTGNTYLAHAVGAGKTIEMIAAGMEQKRLGLIKKPIYVVPNHMLEQFANEFMELYPLANIMVADDENFSAERRKAFIASATMNGPDAIIITHDAFQRVGVKEETVAPIRDEILADLEIELSETAKDNDSRVRRSQLEQQIEAVTQRFDRIIAAGGKDSTIKFEDMGVDFVFADEAHVFRKLDFHTAQQIKGIDPNGSKRALDMYVKTRWLEQQRPGRAMVFASGTPVTNTMGELYTIMRFFAADELDRAGISTFDAWARQFGEVSPALEPNAAGKYELIERFAKFDNVPELMSRVRQFMDVLTSESLGALVKRPDLIGGKPNLNVVAPSAALDAYMKTELSTRIAVSKRWKPSKEQPNNPDPIVAIITDGRFAAIDPRFFGGQLDEGGASIITAMADKVVAGYHAGKDNVYLDKAGKPEPTKGSTQMVFYNLGFGEQSQKNRGFNSRAAFTKRLTDGGIARAHIAWFEDANTDAKKEAIFKAMRSGQIRVLIGSAKKMGTGVNVQKRLAVLHYQDPPWFPADVEQPHGRIIRQGNQNDEVAIEWYTTKGTYQSTMWQMVARKQRFIDQAFMGDKSMRSMDDLGEASLFEQAAAVASGDPRAIQLAGLKQDVERFERLQAAQANEQIAVRSALRNAEWEVTSADRAVATYGAAFKIVGERLFTFTSAKVGAAEYDKMGEFGQALKSAFNQTAADAVTHPAAANERQIATLGDGLVVTLEGSREPESKKLTGNFELSIHVGDLQMHVAMGEGLGAEVDATGLARRVVNKINGVETELQQARRRKASNETDIVRLRKKMGAPFEYQQELAEKYAELKRLEEELHHEGIQAAAAFVAPAVQINADGSTGVPAAPADVPLFSRDADYFRDVDNTYLPAAPTPQAEDGAASTAPAALTGLELLQAMKDTQMLNKQLEKAGMAPVRALRAAPSAGFALARQIGNVFGIKVHYVSKNDDFEGVAYKGVAYIAEGMRNTELAIAGHETLHALEQGNPELSKQLRAQIRTYLKDGVVRDRQAQEQAQSGHMPVSERKAEGEVLADINGAMWIDPVFWSDMAKADRNLFRQVAYKFMQLATQVIGSLRGSRFDVATLVGDVAAVRAIMVATWAEHVQGVEQDMPVDERALFSRDPVGGGQAALDRQQDAARQFAAAELQYGGRAAYGELKAAGGTLLSYPQWIITKTPNFKHYYGHWENEHAADGIESAVHQGERQSQDAEGVHAGRDDVPAGRPPTFPGQSGPVRALGSPESATGGGAHARAAQEPVIYYHGSRADIDSFDLSHGDRKDHGWLGTGVYATTDADLAHSYASLKNGADKPNIAPLFIAVRNPFIATSAVKSKLSRASRADIEQFTDDLKAAGYDGVALNFEDGSQELVAFSPSAVKSAIGNAGGFDAGSADIRFSRAGLGVALGGAANSINAVRLPANYLVGDLFNDSGKLNWWHKSIGTMDNLAKRAPAFGKVYEAVQSFIGDVSRYAVVAADLAPTLLPKLENVGDIFGAARKKPLTAADTKAIGAPIFEGTLVWARDEHGDPIKVKELEDRAALLTVDQKAQVLLQKRIIDDEQNKAWRNSPLDFYEETITRRFNETQLKTGLVWSGAELRAMFRLTDAQIGQYREFRAATDKSLTNLSISEMVKLGGKDAKGMLEKAVGTGDISNAGELLRDHFIALARANPETINMHLDTAKQIMDVADKGADLMARGYAPLSRFGKYTVYVEENGEQEYFGMFESQFEASKMARKMRAEFPDADVRHGTVSEDGYKMFAGVSPETIELFGSMVGLDSQADAKSTEVYQTYLKLAKNNRSSMKRLIQRKGIAGFSEDAGRVLAGFIYSNARLTAGNAHLGEIDAAVTEIPKQQGELMDAAVQLRDHIKNPESAGVKLGGLMFAQFLGGSVASAMVNLTQPLTMTLPYLSQFGGIGKASKRMVSAVRDAGKDVTGDAGLDAALRWATEEGIGFCRISERQLTNQVNCGARTHDESI